jgi:acyl-CoA dehydrogenase
MMQDSAQPWFISPEFGGEGLSFAVYCDRLRQLAQTDAGRAVTVSVHHSVCVAPIMAFGTFAQQTTWLPQLTRTWGAFALTEPNSGSDAKAAELVAVPTEGGYYLSGEKLFITNAPIAGVMLIFAQLHGRLTAFLIPSPSPGLTIVPGDEKLGLKTSPWASLHLDNVWVPNDALLGEPGQGFAIAKDTLIGGRIGIAAIALGLIDRGMGWLQQQQQGNEHDTVTGAEADGLAWWATQQTAAAHLVKHAVALRAAKQPALLAASMAKAFASKTAFALCQHLLACYPACATPTHPIAVAWADAKALEIVEGTNEIQHLVIAKALLDD